MAVHRQARVLWWNHTLVPILADTGEKKTKKRRGLQHNQRNLQQDVSRTFLWKLVILFFSFYGQHYDVSECFLYMENSRLHVVLPQSCECKLPQAHAAFPRLNFCCFVLQWPSGTHVLSVHWKKSTAVKSEWCRGFHDSQHSLETAPSCLHAISSFTSSVTSIVLQKKGNLRFVCASSRCVS